MQNIFLSPLTVEDLALLIEQRSASATRAELEKFFTAKKETTPDLINIKEAATLLSLSPATIYTRCCKGTIPFRKMRGSNRLMFSRAELMALMGGDRHATHTEIGGQADHFLQIKKQK